MTLSILELENFFYPVFFFSALNIKILLRKSVHKRTQESLSLILGRQKPLGYDDGLV
jgi:hypothetical protein